MLKSLIHKSYPLEIKEFDNEGKFSGYGAVFGNIDGWGDVIKKGAFKNSIKSRKPVMLWQHDSSEPIGYYEKIFEDDTGLFVEGQLLLDIEKAKEAHILLKNKAIKGLSIGYIPVDWRYEKLNGQEVRMLNEIDLWEVSLVTFPANPAANVTDVKSLQTIRDVENALRDAGFSQVEAKAVISACKSSIQRDAELDDEIKAAQNLLNLMKGNN